MLTPATPASTLVLQLHFERWACMRLAGQSTANELAESDGSVEMKLKAGLDGSGAIAITSDLTRVDAHGVMGDTIRSGDLGPELREKVSAAVFAAVRGAADLKTNLPPAIRESATLESARFQDIGVGAVNVVLEGQLQATDAQVSALASQLNQTLSAEAPAPAAAPPR